MIPKSGNWFSDKIMRKLKFDAKTAPARMTGAATLLNETRDAARYTFMEQGFCSLFG
jgi:hypothetical protein